MLNKNDIIDIDIIDLTVEGAGIGKPDGQAVFVQKALPGERVRAKIIKVAKKYAIGRLEMIISASECRQTPFCALFERCGGCTLQHFTYESQLKYKTKHIRDCFARLGGLDISLPEVSAAENIRDYRNKASFPVAQVNGKAAAGFYAPRSHRIAVGDCPIQKQAINEIKNAVVEWANDIGMAAYDEITGRGVLRHIVARQAQSGDLMAGIVVCRPIADDALTAALSRIQGVVSVIENINPDKTNVILGDTSRVLFGEDTIIEQYSGRKFNVALTSFLQVNHEQTEKLYNAVLEYADIGETDVVFDLFCGIGTISLLAAQHASRVVGIEYAQSAVDNAKSNAQLNGIDNTDFLAGDAGEKLSEAAVLAGKPDVVIVDPPRKGCDAALIAGIADVRPGRVVYVSCNPATLARDAALLANHGYKVCAVQGVDMFPHTTHIETVALFETEG